MVKFVVAMEFVSLAVLVSAIFTGITSSIFFGALRAFCNNLAVLEGFF